MIHILSSHHSLCLPSPSSPTLSPSPCLSFTFPLPPNKKKKYYRALRKELFQVELCDTFDILTQKMKIFDNIKLYLILLKGKIFVLVNFKYVAACRNSGDVRRYKQLTI
jgi:hypothetical protein